MRHVALTPDVVVEQGAFVGCILLEVLAESGGFEFDTGDTDELGCNDPTVGITMFAKWRN